MSSNNRLVQIYNSRNTILNILEKMYSYDISEYEGFSLNEIDAMIATEQLDMILVKTNSENASADTEHKLVDAKSKMYIKYYMRSTMNESQLQVYVEDLYFDSNTLTKDDTLIVIFENEPNASLIEYLKHLYNQDGIFVVVHNIERLQFNILEHQLVPKISILNESDTAELIKTYNLKSLNQLPEISRFDPQALAVCLRPGQVCKLIRSSPTSMTSTYYRVCV